jgi:hypothetical protein
MININMLTAGVYKKKKELPLRSISSSVILAFSLPEGLPFPFIHFRKSSFGS